MSTPPPRATMRLQFHRGFPFEAAIRLVPYMAGLGVSHLYASPILTARAGSMHGYDVVDPTRINPELGGEEGYRRLVAALRRAGLGIILDIVPNHMAVGGSDNPWWLDLLQNGPRSPYAGFFDIDWMTPAPHLRGKILAPFLGRPYGEVLAAGELVLDRSAWRGRPAIRYFQHLFPIAPADWAEIATGDAAAFDAETEVGRAALHRLIERQHYRLAWWRTADEEINWRRFFDVNELAGLRVERDEVFEATHALLFRLYREGWVDGFRADHVDGLTDPAAYCRRLRARLEQLAPGRHAYLVVEKILGAGEELPRGWSVDGTTGYDFMNDVSALLHAPAGEAPLNALWAETAGRSVSFEAEETEARREIVTRSFSAQLDAAVMALHDQAQQDSVSRDWTRAAIRRVLVELIAQFRAYRTYATDGRLQPMDAAPFGRALAAAAAACRRADRPLLAQLGRWLDGGPAWQPALIRVQQLSAPVAAKAVEDTAFYRYGRLLSRTDVGFDPARFAMPVAAFHAALARRRDSFPQAMLATATHDHKRGEDIRARLAVLSECPDRWAGAVRRWRRLNAGLRGAAPSPGDEAILYQMIVGAWPPALSLHDEAGMSGFADRLADWQRKSSREAKLATDWTAPDDAYEAGAERFLRAVLAPGAPALADMAVFAEEIAPAGAVNALSQLILKLAAPGLPDLYQGTEFWDFSLVDPDNRRPVDFAARIHALAAAESLPLLARGWRDGRIKQGVIARALDLRRRHPRVFSEGAYAPLRVTGPRAGHVVAFARRFEEGVVVVLAMRHALALLPAKDAIVPAREIWDGTSVRLPEDWRGGMLRSEFGDAAIALEGGAVPLSGAFSGLPIALMSSGFPS